MRRFFAEPEDIGEDRVSIRGDEARHRARVLRLRPGDRVWVFDGRGYEYLVSLDSVTSTLVHGRIVETGEFKNEAALQVTLVQALTRGDKMDFVVQKAVELGVSRIIPVETRRTVVRLEGMRAEEKVKRWNRVAREACKQCGRRQPPEVEPLTDLPGALNQLGSLPGMFFFEETRDLSLKLILAERGQEIMSRGVAVYIGPEGGFSPDEAALAREAGLNLAGLGPRVLRTETAGLAALAIMMYELGDLG